MLIRIMGCKEREDNINKMLSSLGEQAEVIWDKNHDACDTLCRTLDSNESMLILEDDIELCKDFLEKAKKEIEENPDLFIMFYSFGPWETGEIDFLKRMGVFTQAYYVPKGIGKRLSRFVNGNKSSHHCRYSRGIKKFLDMEKIKIHLVRPSLVQHIGNDSILQPGEICMHRSHTYKYE